MSNLSEKKRRVLFVTAIIFAVIGVVYEFAFSGRISSPPDSEMIDSAITRLVGSVAIACLLPSFGYKVFNKPSAFAVLSVLPCFAAVICNPPLIGLFLGDAEIIYGVIIANIFYNLADEIQVGSHLAVFYHRTEVVAQNAAEIVVARGRKEGSTVRKHTYKRADMPRCGKVLQMLFHTDLVIQKPPCGTVLHFTFCLARLKATV